jgi:hypothetical protein
MRLSSGKINHLSHLIAEHIEESHSVDCFRDKNDIRLRIKIIITDELKLDEDIDKDIRRSLSSMAKSPPEGSKEWEVMYEKAYNEEMSKRRLRSDNVRRLN